MATFQHDGVTYTVRARTVFEDDIHASVWVALAKQLAKRFGDDLDKLPAALDRMARVFVSFNQVTTTDKPVKWAVDIYATSDADLVKPFEAFRQCVLTTDLGAKWKAAYDEANKETSDPQPVSGGEPDATSS